MGVGERTYVDVDGEKKISNRNPYLCRRETPLEVWVEQEYSGSKGGSEETKERGLVR